MFLPNKERIQNLLIFLVILGDIFLIIFADVSSFTLRFVANIYNPPKNFYEYLKLFFPILTIRLISFYVFGLYYKLNLKTTFETITSTLKATTFSSLLIVILAFYSRTFAYPRLVIILSWLFTFFLCVLWRLILKNLFSLFFGKRMFFKRTIIVGTDKEAERLSLHINNDAYTNYELVGFIETKKEDSMESGTLNILGKLEDLPQIIKNEDIEEIIFATKDIPQEEFIKLIQKISSKKLINFKVMPNIYEALMGKLITYPLNNQYPIFISPLEREFHWYKGFKRIFDIVFSILVLILAIPIMLIVSILIKLTSPGPILYKQERVGLYGKPFILYKFRTMYADSEKSGPLWAKENDTRITPLGRFLRKTRIDELPQLINVIKNEMSLVGPRPERPYFVEKLSCEIPFYLERLTVKPGLTGWAQINYPYADSVEDNQKKIIYDLFYIRNMSFSLDIYILFKTIFIILQEKGAH